MNNTVSTPKPSETKTPASSSTKRGEVQSLNYTPKPLKREFKAIQDFMGFMRNGHNLEPGDLDRIENEYALFMSRYYQELYFESLEVLNEKTLS